MDRRGSLINIKTIALFLAAQLLIVAAFGGESSAADLYGIIKSYDIPQTRMIVEGFKSSFPEAEVAELVLGKSLKSNEEAVKKFIAAKKPSVLICLGLMAAVSSAKAEKRIPILFTMVINYMRYYKKYPEIGQKNVAGIAMEIPPSSQITQFRMLYPGLKSLGVPYNPEASSEIIKNAIRSSKALNIKIVPIPVMEAKNIEEELKKNSKAFNGLWMIGDVKLYNKKTNALQKLVGFSNESNIPLLAFSENFVKAGAFFSVSINYKSLGSQVALMGRSLVIDKVRPEKLKVAQPIGTFTVLNRTAAEKILGEKFDDSMLDQVDRVYPSDETGESEAGAEDIDE
ncbi:MAG: hypothetical protein JW807_07690 [Spirochaetes bacterium]|nr:hypothetical protein [Spirochaetota bacterium]